VNPILRAFLNTAFSELMLLLMLSVPHIAFPRACVAIAMGNFAYQCVLFAGITNNL
jgi:hypothetical protein